MCDQFIRNTKNDLTCSYKLWNLKIFEQSKTLLDDYQKDDNKTDQKETAISKTAKKSKTLNL